MNKDLILSVIEKQHLGGLTEQVRWKIKDNKILVNFSVSLKDCIGEVVANFPLEDCELGIYDLTQFNKLVKIVKDPIQVTIDKKGDKALKLCISDASLDLEYNLGDLGLISEGKLTNELPDPVVSLNLTKEFSDKFIKSHNSLEKADIFTLTTSITKQKEKVVNFTIGLTDKFSNKIKFYEVVDKYSELPTFKYNVSNFREILLANKDADLTMFIYNMGIIRIDSVTENIKVTYYLVPLR